MAEMAAKGWEIKHIGAFLWEFKRAERLNKKFCVFYAKNDRVDSPIIAESHSTQENLNVENGWRKEIQWRQMQVFSADEESDSLKINETVRFNNACIAMNQTFVPSWVISFAGMMILAILEGIKYFGSSSYCDKGTILVFLIALYGTFLAGVQLVGYLFWVKASKKKISEGGTCASAVWQSGLMKMLMIGFIAVIITILLVTLFG